MWLIAVKIDKKKNVYFLVPIAIPDRYSRWLSPISIGGKAIGGKQKLV
jgi:hypothetical protein